MVGSPAGSMPRESDPLHFASFRVFRGRSIPGFRIIVAGGTTRATSPDRRLRSRGRSGNCWARGRSPEDWPRWHRPVASPSTPASAGAHYRRRGGKPGVRADRRIRSRPGFAGDGKGRNVFAFASWRVGIIDRNRAADCNGILPTLLRLSNAHRLSAMLAR